MLRTRGWTNWRKKDQANDAPSKSGPDNKPPEIEIRSAFNQGLEDRREEINERCRKTSIMEPVRQALKQLEKAALAAEGSLITFLKDLNDIDGFYVAGSENGEPLTDNPRNFYIFRGLNKPSEEDSESFRLNILGEEPDILLHINTNALMPAYTLDYDDGGLPRYTLYTNYENAPKDNTQADLFTSYLPDVVKEIAYSIAKIGAGHEKDLRPMIEEFQQDLEDRFSEIYDKHEQVLQCQETVARQYDRAFSM